MERRASERYDASIPVKYYCDHDLYAGTVENLSEGGMFIRTGNFLPCINSLEIVMPLHNGIACLPAEIRRIEKVDDENLNIGVEIKNPPEGYLRLVRQLMCALHA